MKTSCGNVVLAIVCVLMGARASLSTTELSDVTHQRVPAGGTESAVFADLDQDGDGDLVLAVSDSSRVLRLFRNDGGVAGFVEITDDVKLPTLTGGGFRVAAGDLDRDTDVDIVTCGAIPTGPYSPTICRVLLNTFAQDGTVGFQDATTAMGFPGGVERVIPLLADHDGDQDVDVLLFGWAPETQSQLVQNDLDRGQLSFTSLPSTALPVRGAARHVVALDPQAQELYISRAQAKDQFLVYNRDLGVYEDRTADRGLPTRASPARLAAAVDLDGNGLTDLFLQGNGVRLAEFASQFGTANCAGGCASDADGDGDVDGTDLGWEYIKRTQVLLRDESGGFQDRTADSGGLEGLLEFRPPAVVAEDFNRDRLPDLYLVGDDRQPSRLLINERPVQGTAGAPRFVDLATEAGVATTPPASTAVTSLRMGKCDFGVDLAVASADRGENTLVHGFPDDSLGRTIGALPSGRETVAAFDNGCVDGTSGPDRLVGHRVASVLSGEGGDDVLVARAGLTVMQGGPGRDTYEAAGVTVIRLPLAEIVAGETIDCAGADAVIIDSELSLQRLEAAGVVFEDCIEEGFCEGQDPAGGEGTVPEDEEGFFCHEGTGIVRVMDFAAETRDEPFAVLHRALDLDLHLTYGRTGFGECTSNADCYAIGLDACRTAFGDIPFGGARGWCFPTDFDGLDGSVIEWCDDPFWARYRFEEVQDLFEPDDRRFLIPMTVWLPRSDALSSSNVCPDSLPAPRSISSWHDSLVAAMNSAAQRYGAWKVGFDYRFRVFEIPADSDFVGDPDTDPCRTNLDYPQDLPNSIGNLLQAYPDKYVPGEINVYLTDLGRSGTGASYSEPVSFIVLHGKAGALTHELGHQLALAHPFDGGNISVTGANPEKSESRDSWAFRPFPDDDMNRLALCSSDADCDGVDAGSGDCRKAPGAIFGYCRNLKIDCAQDGDRVCDTPWDSIPCFQGIGSKEGEPCDGNADCWSAAGQRGVSYKTSCQGGFCQAVDCGSNSDCGGDSFCALGACVNWKGGYEACCDVHADRNEPYNHDSCWERRPNGNVVPVSGVGSSTTWPLPENVMTYHSAGGRPRSFTDGQRDRVVCRLSYLKKWGPIQRLGNEDGEPCSLRLGYGFDDYGPGFATSANLTTLAAHGACDSGVCSIQTNGGATLATCVPSTCSDGVRGSAETGVDCGGVCPTPCAYGKGCATNTDCDAGPCVEGLCQPTCDDGVKNGSEVVTDGGGIGFDPTCDDQGVGERCRFDDDCTGATTCTVEVDCVLSADCPVNQDQPACTSGADCPFGGECRILTSFCGAQTCFIDAQCPTGFCNAATNRCACEDSGDCPAGGDICVVEKSLCLSQCVDGRCLGECELGIGL